MKRTLPIFLIFILALIFFWKIILRGLVPFPGDLLIGSYYPWYEYKWGFVAGVPVKNGLISDVFSEIYIWKDLAIESFKIGQFPLWNPFSYSGYPLLANFSSGVLYPLNLLMLWGSSGWSLMVILQVVGAGLGMYWFLTLKKHSRLASLGGAIAFAFSSSMMIRLEWNSAGHVMMWLAGIMAIIETYFENNRKVIILLPPAIFLMVTAGHFQTMLYSFALIGVYGIYKLLQGKDPRHFLELGIATILGVALSSIQLLPTISMMKESVRFVEDAASQGNYGLLPLGNIVSMVAPDFYGNPATGNYWGFLNYSETIFYPGTLGVIALIWASVNSKVLRRSSRLFYFIAITSIVFAFDNPISRLIYDLKVPVLSTGYASRISVVLMFATSALIADWLGRLTKMKLKEAIFPPLLILAVIIVGFCFSEYGRHVFLIDESLMADWLGRMNVIRRNLIWPSLLVAGTITMLLLRKYDWIKIFIITLLVADLFRFGWKYNPFVKKEWVYPDTKVTDFLKSQPGLFRVEAQKGPILPASTWTMYGLYSASGYDPLANKDYVYEYSRQLNNSDLVTRYSILENYDSVNLGKFNVKYLLVIKDYPGSYSKDLKKWKSVLETEKVIVYENPYVLNRADWVGNGEGTVIVEKYSPNEVKLNYSSSVEGEVVLRDSWDKGWKARVNGNPVQINKFENLFRVIKVPSGEGIIEMKYDPDEWNLGKKFNLIGLVSWILLGIYIIKRRHE